MDKTDYQKAFALACRTMGDHIGCPAVYISDIHSPECNGESEQCGNDALWECWQRYFRERVNNEQVCRVCGCTEDNACPGGCCWVEDDLCSACASEQMQYFEFKSNVSGSYYALICAPNHERAVSIYSSDIAELDENHPGPEEISRDEAKMKYLNFSKNIEEDTEYFETAENEVLLVDGDLT